MEGLTLKTLLFPLINGGLTLDRELLSTQTNVIPSNKCDTPALFQVPQLIWIPIIPPCARIFIAMAKLPVQTGWGKGTRP